MPDNKTVALITGASSGLGLEFCRQLAPRCDVIIAVARRLEDLQSLAEELATQVEMRPVEADLATIEGLARTMEILRQQGPADILVNNAGFVSCGTLSDVPIEEQRALLSLHCDAVVTLCRAAVPYMRERGGGTIVNVSSLGAFMPGAGLAVYAASKMFINSFSQALQAEVAAQGIEIQVLCPDMVGAGIYEPLVERQFDTSQFPEQLRTDPEEVVAASLAALGTGKLFVIPGEGNRESALRGVHALAKALED